LNNKIEFGAALYIRRIMSWRYHFVSDFLDWRRRRRNSWKQKTCM